MSSAQRALDGALLVRKHSGVSSFGVIEDLQRTLLEELRRGAPETRKRDLPKMGHGGTLDPFATGLLAVCVGRGVKLARYFLRSRKTYEGVIRFGETTVPGDPTEPVSGRSDVLPDSLEAIQAAAHEFTLAPYAQVPPMHSAKKQGGKALYELAREGIEVEREAKQLTIHSFRILSYTAPHAAFHVECSSGTYVRQLAKDLAVKLGTVAMLDSLNRTASGIHSAERALSCAEIAEATRAGKSWDELPAWVPFDRLLDGYDRAEASREDMVALFQGKQGGLGRILAHIRPGIAAHQVSAGAGIGQGAASGSGFAAPAEPSDLPSAAPVAIYHDSALIAVARMDHGQWGLERVFVPETANGAPGAAAGS